MDYKKDIKRWRLILGKDTEEDFTSMDSEAISSFSEEDWLMDRALDAIYNPTGKFMSGESGAGAEKDHLIHKLVNGLEILEIYLIKN